MKGSTGGDPAWSTVVNLSHFDGSNGSTTFTNNGSQSAFNPGGGASDSIATAQSVFGGSSLRRVTTGYTNAGADADYAFGNSDFTIEFRFRPDTVQTANVFDMRTTGTANARASTIYTLTNGSLIYHVSNADRITSATGVITATTWAAIAVSRVSGTTRMFVNGTQVGSNYTDSTNYDQGTNPTCGSWTAGQQNAYYDEVRISNGVFGSGAGRYAANYTIASSAFPNS